MGTVAYMSPEQAVGKPLDFRSDQFSLGTVLYEMAAGRRPFDRPSRPETLTAILREEPESLASAARSAPAPLRWIVERCLAKDPDERYASTRDLARDLAQVATRLSSLSAPGPAARAGTSNAGLRAHRSRASRCRPWTSRGRRGSSAPRPRAHGDSAPTHARDVLIRTAGAAGLLARRQAPRLRHGRAREPRHSRSAVRRRGADPGGRDRCRRGTAGLVSGRDEDCVLLGPRPRGAPQLRARPGRAHGARRRQGAGISSSCPRSAGRPSSSWRTATTPPGRRTGRASSTSRIAAGSGTSGRSRRTEVHPCG